MNRAPTMHHLARALPEEERKELYKRITQSLSLSAQSEQKVYHAELDQEHRRELVRKDIEELTLFSRIRLWLRRFFTGSPLDEAFVEMRLTDIKYDLKRSAFQISEPEASRVDGRVAQAVYSFYERIAEAIRKVQAMWASEDRVRELVAQLLSESVPESKSSLQEFISKRELQDMFLNTESKEALRKAAVSALNSFIHDIHDSVFEHTKEKVLTLYYLRDLSFFSFSSFFSAFAGSIEQGDSEEGGEGEQDAFEDADMSSVIDLMESFYCALHLAAQAAPIDSDVVRAYLRVVSPESWEESQVKEQAELIRAMQEAVRSFRDTAPLVDLVKFHRGDPYHRLLLYTPKLRLRQFYHSSMKIKILSELDELYPEIRTDAIGEVVHLIFGHEPGELRFYRGLAAGNLKRFGLPAFRYVRSLNVAFRMVHKVYPERYQYLIRLLIRIMPPGRREISGGIHSHGTAIEELATRIEDFDNSLSPDADDGKLFHKIRHATDIDASQQRAYRVMVSQKDREAREMITESKDHFDGLGEYFESLTSSVSDQLGERYQAFDPGTASKSSLDATLNERIVELKNFTMLVNQLLAVEEGA